MVGLFPHLPGRNVSHNSEERPDSAGALKPLTETVARLMYERMGFIKEADLGERLGVKHARYVLRLDGTHASGVQT